MKNKLIRIVFVVTMCVTIGSCKKFVEVGPPQTTYTDENVFFQENSAISALNGIYVGLATTMSTTSSYWISVHSSLSADDLTLFSGNTNIILNGYYKNMLSSDPNATVGEGCWNTFYNLIWQCNMAVKGLNASQALKPSTKDQLLGEVFFIRAFCYFYLVNLYGDVPLMLGTDPEVNRKLLRLPKSDVYNQIVTDLRNAQSILNQKFVDVNLNPYSSTMTAERIRPNSFAATALLARVYLHIKRYAEAENEASKVILETNQFNLLPINSVFLKNSREAIWQLQPILTGRNTEDGALFILPSTGPGVTNNSLYLSQSLLSVFESGDLRKINGNWVNTVVTNTGQSYSYPFKYKANVGAVTEYYMMLRLAEQYLIRAEARAHLGRITGPNSAAEDLNVIRSRAGLNPTSATSQGSLIEAIVKERRVEFFTEMGLRWLDIKRTEKVDAVMTLESIDKQTTWESYQQLYPIPFNDINRAPQLVQNPGYH